MHGVSTRIQAELAELDDLVLEHVIRYPGLSSYEIARARRLITAGGNVSKQRAERALMRLLFKSEVAFDRMRWPAPGGYKITWHATRSDKMPRLTNREAAINGLDVANNPETIADEDRIVAALIGIGYAILDVADSNRDRTAEIVRGLKP